MTTATQEGLTASTALAAEIRAEIARQGLSAAAVADRLGTTGAWMSRRLGRNADVDFTVDDVLRISQALGVDAEGLLVAALCACRDSNPKPSDLVSGRFLSPFELARCPVCGAWTMDGFCRTGCQSQADTEWALAA